MSSETWVAVASVDEFLATGATRQAAVDALMDAWRTYADKCGTDPDTVHEEDVAVVEGPLGSVFRDGWQIG